MAPAQPVALAVAGDGGLYVADPSRNVILEWRPHGGFRIVAGTGAAGSTGDGGPADRAAIDHPTRLVIARNGTLYFTAQASDRTPHTVIREITPAGTISTIAGLRPRCPPRAVDSIGAESASFDGASLSLLPDGALAVYADVCVGATDEPVLGPNLLLTSSGRFVRDTSTLVPTVAWQADDCGIGVAGPGFRAYACESGLRHPRQLLVIRRDGSSATYRAYRPAEIAVRHGEVVAVYDDSLVRVTSRRLVPLLTDHELLRALRTRLIWDILGPALDARGDVFFVASIENVARRGCRSLILERTAGGSIRRIWASPAARNAICY